MGTAYIEGYETAIPDLFKKIMDLQSSLKRLDEAKKLLIQLADSLHSQFGTFHNIS